MLPSASHVPADPAQRAERAVEVVGAGQRPRLDDVEQVGLGRARAPSRARGRRRRRRSPRRRARGTRSSVAAAAQRLGQLGVLLGRQQPHAATGRRARAARRRRAARASRGRPPSSSRSRPDEGQGQPAVRLQQGAGGLGRGRALGEQARVDGQQHRGVEVVGGHLDVGEVGHGQRGVGRRAGTCQGLAGGGDVVGGGVRVALDQARGGRPARAARRSSRGRCSRRGRRRRRRAGRGRRSASSRGARRQAAASSTADEVAGGDALPGGGSRATSFSHGSSSGPRGPELPVARQLPPGGAPAPHPPALPSSDARDAPDASDAVRLSRARGYLRRSGAHQRRCLLGGSPVPPAECPGRAGRRPIGGRRRRAGPAGELRRGFGARHDGRPGRRRPAGDHPRGVPRRSRSTLAVRPGHDAGRRALGGQPSARPRADRRLAGGEPARRHAAAHDVDRGGGRGRRRRGVRRRRLRADRRRALRAGAAGRRTSPTTPGAVTRFVLVAPPGPLPAPTGNDKTSLVAVVGDRTGALLELLQRVRRPRHLADPHRVAAHPRAAAASTRSPSTARATSPTARVGEALAALHRVCDDVRFLGSYPRADGRREQAGAAGRPATTRSPRPRRGWSGSAPAAVIVVRCAWLRPRLPSAQLRLAARVPLGSRSGPSPACWATRPGRRSA